MYFGSRTLAQEFEAIICVALNKVGHDYIQNQINEYQVQEENKANQKPQEYQFGFNVLDARVEVSKASKAIDAFLIDRDRTLMDNFSKERREKNKRLVEHLRLEERQKTENRIIDARIAVHADSKIPDILNNCKNRFGGDCTKDCIKVVVSKIQNIQNRKRKEDGIKGVSTNGAGVIHSDFAECDHRCRIEVEGTLANYMFLLNNARHLNSCCDLENPNRLS